jgi:hypothetical protein
MGQQVLEDGQSFAVAPQLDGLTIAKYLEVAKESDLQIGLVTDSRTYWCLMIVDGP